MNLKKYKKIVKDDQKNEPIIKDCLFAFLGGGIMGLIGQGLIDFNLYILKLDETQSSAFMSIIIVFIASLLTLFGVYKHLGRIFGAGLFLPTTGFANSLTSAAIEGRHEGFILGVGSQIFSLAGSVVTFGVFTSLIMLIIKFFLTLFGVNLW